MGAESKAAVAGCLLLVTVSPLLILLVFFMPLLMILGLLPGFEDSDAANETTCGTSNVDVPDRAKPWMAEAEKTSGIPAGWFAVVAKRESDFEPANFTNDINHGTWGLFQLNREEWTKVYGAGNERDGKTPVGITDPMVHAHYAGIYFKERLKEVRRLKKVHPKKPFAQLTDLQALAVAHNSGERNLQKYPTLPSVTADYLTDIRTNYSDCEIVADAGKLHGKDDYKSYWKQKANHANGDDPWNFFWGECTSYSAFSVRTYTKYKDFSNYWKGAKFGNANTWHKAARATGIQVDKRPAVGAIAQRTTGKWGHVAFITRVHADGSFDINEYNHGPTHQFGTRTHVRIPADFNNILHFEK